jgi:hypothetical protein
VGAPGSGNLVLDAGALIAIERGDRRLLRALEVADEVHVPAGVLAQVWRDPRRQARLARLVGTDGTSIHPLTGDAARTVGLLCGRARTSDVIDASVVVLARELNASVVTSDLDDLARLAPDLRITTI